jgi:hypothetical protein
MYFSWSILHEKSVFWWQKFLLKPRYIIRKRQLLFYVNISCYRWKNNVMLSEIVKFSEIHLARHKRPNIFFSAVVSNALSLWSSLCLCHILSRNFHVYLNSINKHSDVLDDGWRSVRLLLTLHRYKQPWASGMCQYMLQTSNMSFSQTSLINGFTLF